MKKFIVIISLLIGFQAANAQSDVLDFIKAGKADANRMFEGYLEPFAFALSDGLNNNWYNSAATHEFLGFDISVTASAIQIPTSAQTFDLNSIGLTEFTVQGSNGLTPTIAGAETPGPTLSNGTAQFQAPQGIDLNIVPVPMAQLTVGVLPNTDMMIRYSPTLTFDMEDDQAKIGLKGIGMKHNLMKSISADMPFDAAIFAGYSKIDAESTMNLDPGDIGSDGISITFQGNGQPILQVSSKTLKYGAIVSKKLGPLTIWGSIAQNNSNLTIDLLGTYVITTSVSGTQIDTETLSDPIDLSFDSSTVSYDLGARLKLGFISLFGSISKAQYTSLNGGVSIGFR